MKVKKSLILVYLREKKSVLRKVKEKKSILFLYRILNNVKVYDFGILETSKGLWKACQLSALISTNILSNREKI